MLLLLLNIQILNLDLEDPKIKKEIRKKISSKNLTTGILACNSLKIFVNFSFSVFDFSGLELMTVGLFCVKFGCCCCCGFPS